MFPRQVPHSLCSTIFVSLLFFDRADGIRWLVTPHEQTNVQQGHPFSLQWHYVMDENETFLDSEINFFIYSQPYGSTMASRHKGENAYAKLQMQDLLFSIFGKNNVALKIHSAAIGQNITYCCEVQWKSETWKRKDKRCSKVFVYDVPRITLIPKRSCKQGDLIKLECNATGIPTPHVEWIHDDTQKLIDSSSDTVLNITGKRSEGRYCCDANNGFGIETACTIVNVTEYEPWNTTLLVKQTNRDVINFFHVKCDADASPPANHFIIKIIDKEYNSSDGEITIKVRDPRKDKMENIAVSCIPGSKYGQGPVKRVVLPLNVPPRMKAPLRTQYNMTVSNITLECDATGIPTPNITWTNGDTGDTVGTGKYYQVPYVKCATRTMTFYCHAMNAVGNIKSPEIHVNVMAACIFNTTDKGLDKTTQMSSENWIILMSCVVVGVVIVVIIIALLRRKNKPRKDAGSTNPICEDPYQEPLDAVVPGRDGSQSLLARSNITSTDDGYATVEDFAVIPKSENVYTPMDAKHEEDMEDIPYQEPLDAVVPVRDGSQSLLARRNTTSTDDGYATIKECGLRPRKLNVSIPTQHERHIEDNPYQEPLDAVVPQQDEPQVIATNNATVEECTLIPKKQNACIPMNTKHEERMEENPYQEPLDAVVSGRDRSQSLITRSSTTSTDEGYASAIEVYIPMGTKLEEDMEDIPYQEPLDDVVPEQDEPQAVATNNAIIEECVLKPRRDAKITLDPEEEDSNYEPLIQLVPYDI